jgi:hypothetical protein
LVQRLTGQATAAAVPVEIQLVMTDKTLFAGADEPADVSGIGPVPAPLIRHWLCGDATKHGMQAAAWIRRLYASPTNGQLISMDSRRRCFDGQLRQFVITADRTCRTPWCDAPIRHVDHPRRAADGGGTSVDNGTGLCESCNYAKEAPGWRTDPLGNRVLEVRTPTGHRTPPPPVGQTTERASPHLISHRARPRTQRAALASSGSALS